MDRFVGAGVLLQSSSSYGVRLIRELFSHKLRRHLAFVAATRGCICSPTGIATAGGALGLDKVPCFSASFLTSITKLTWGSYKTLVASIDV